MLISLSSRLGMARFSSYGDALPDSSDRRLRAGAGMVVQGPGGGLKVGGGKGRDQLFKRASDDRQGAKNRPAGGVPQCVRSAAPAAGGACPGCGDEGEDRTA